MDFQHTYIDNKTLISKIRVENLIKENKDIAAITVAIGTEIDKAVAFLNETDNDRIDQYMNCYKYLYDQYEHCGDCTKMSITCIRCMLEDDYNKALELTQLNNNLQLSFILATEDKWELDFKDRYEIWNKLPEEEKEIYINRANKFIDYLSMLF